MKLSEYIKSSGYTLLTVPDFDDRDITGCYAGDLLSWVMGRAQSGDVWITVMSNINIVAVAALADTACIVLAEGVIPDESVIEKADMQDIVILSSEKTAYELCAEYAGMRDN